MSAQAAVSGITKHRFTLGLALGLLPFLVSLVLRPNLNVRPAAGAAVACTSARSMNATARRAWLEYQAFLIEDSKRFQGTATKSYAGYAGPWLETTFLDYWRAARAEGIDMGDRLYLPIAYLNCRFHCPREQRNALKDYYATLKPEYRYFSVYMLAKGLEGLEINVPPGLDMMLFSLGSTSRGVRTVPLPHLKQVLSPRGDLPKDVKVSFYGRVRTHKLRRDMAEQLAGHGYLFSTGNESQTIEVMERSNFTLAPRGYGTTSYRMYEALQLLSVPIYIWKYDLLLPYQELVNWNEVAIVVHEREMRTLPKRIEAFDLETAAARMKAAQHLWTYDFAHQYIVQRLQQEDCLPAVPYSTHTDIPGRD